MKKLIQLVLTLPVALVVLAAKVVGFVRYGQPGPFLVSARTGDVSYKYRMSAGFAGDVSRGHPVSIEPVLQDTTHPVLAYGAPAIIDATSQAARQLIASDTAVTDIYGISVRPTPTQQASASNYGQASLGVATPPTSGVIDVVKDGYITVNLPAGGTPKKGGQVHVWIAADSGAHKQGQFEASATGGSTIACANVKFNGGIDSANNVEVVISPARN